MKKCPCCGSVLLEPGVALTPTLRRLYDIIKLGTPCNSEQELGRKLYGFRVFTKTAVRTNLFLLRERLANSDYRIVSKPYRVVRVVSRQKLPATPIAAPLE